MHASHRRRALHRSAALVLILVLATVSISWVRAAAPTASPEIEVMKTTRLRPTHADDRGSIRTVGERDGVALTARERTLLSEGRDARREAGLDTGGAR